MAEERSQSRSERCPKCGGVTMCICAERNALDDEQDYAAMLACRRHSDAVDAEAQGLAENVAIRIHHGFLAFRGLV